MELYIPQPEELWFKETMLSDTQTMSYNHAYGGTIPFPKEKWASWYDKWLINCGKERFYRYIKNNGTFVGEVAYHRDPQRKIYLADVIVYAPFRGMGYGTEALKLLCEAAKDHGIDALYDDIAIDNPSIALFTKCGFQVVLRSEEYILVKKEL